ARMVNRELSARNVGDTIPPRRTFARTLEKPYANTAGSFKETRFPGLLVSFEEGLANKARPHNRGLMGGDASAAAGEIKVIPPAKIGRRVGFVGAQPIETGKSLITKCLVTSGLEQKQITPCHEAAALCRVEGFDADKRTNVPR